MEANDERPIVTGYNGSDRGRDGLALTRLLATALDAEVEVLAVLTYAPTELSITQYERMLRDDKRRLADEARAALTEVISVHTTVIPAGSATRELHDLAEARGAQVIVLGSTHRGPLGRVFPGTVADRLLAAAPCAIAVAPVGFAERDARIARIAVAFDGSGEARMALDWAAAIAERIRASLLLLAVAGPHDTAGAAHAAGGWAGKALSAEGAEHEVGRLEQVVDSALDELPAGVGASAKVVRGEPAEAIAAASADVDLIVIGSRGYGPLGRVLLGGTASALLRAAACPVVVTPRPTPGS